MLLSIDSIYVDISFRSSGNTESAERLKRNLDNQLIGVMGFYILTSKVGASLRDTVQVRGSNTHKILKNSYFIWKLCVRFFPGVR